MKYTNLAELPTVVDIKTAASALGLSRTYAYELAKNNQFPCRIIRIGSTYRVPTADLLSLLGVDRLRMDHANTE
ncbi:helix-turn-helix transcriptional regulator [Actinomadura xylanilytica]|uniref:helix-turn-helix transcriptional regulator n=1 Tax=Actinomadura xylanilytica TaxID=887459 RepID=UPI00255A89DA|nr:helix-turn-helix domain-containing protein [Actinomadura xylanilytica]MDL4770743.1 helix-turn-helix domain-containing protein [Actinomadura xylanilytica]